MMLGTTCISQNKPCTSKWHQKYSAKSCRTQRMKQDAGAAKVRPTCASLIDISRPCCCRSLQVVRCTQATRVQTDDMEVAGPRPPAIVVSNETAEPSELPHSAPTLNTSLWKERSTTTKGMKREISVSPSRTKDQSALLQDFAVYPTCQFEA